MLPWISALIAASLSVSCNAVRLRAGVAREDPIVTQTDVTIDTAFAPSERQIVNGTELCRVKGHDGMAMRVWVSPVSEFRGQVVNLRLLEFHPPNSTESAPSEAESEIRCLGQPSPSCFAGACGNCPCVRDSREMLAPSMRLVFQQLESELCAGPEARRLLLVGLGGGELAQQMAAKCPDIHIDAVEIDPNVIDLAQRYLGLQAGPALTITQGSALSEVRRLARRNGTKYDAVVIDCFGGAGHVPAECRSPEFLSFVVQNLRPGGVAMQSIWHYSPYDAETVGKNFIDIKKAYAQEFGSEPIVMPVDLPIDIQWVDILQVRRLGSKSMGGLRRFGKPFVSRVAR